MFIEALATKAQVTSYNKIFIWPCKTRKEAKPHGENPPLRMDMTEMIKNDFNGSSSSLELAERTTSW